MKKRTEKRLEEIGEGHDWQEGQTWGGGGTELKRTDRCRYCGLSRHYHSDAQNGIDEDYTFESFAGESIPLIDVPETCREGETSTT